jgi:hypothetical protein
MSTLSSWCLIFAVACFIGGCLSWELAALLVLTAAAAASFNNWRGGLA